MTASTTSPLLSLAEIISSGVRTLEAAYAKDGVPYPSLDDPLSPSPLSLGADPVLQQTSRLIVAAAYQIIATVRPPMETIMDFAPAQYMSSSLATVVEAHVPDVLKEAGSQVRPFSPVGIVYHSCVRLLRVFTLVRSPLTLGQSQI